MAQAPSARPCSDIGALYFLQTRSVQVVGGVQYMEIIDICFYDRYNFCGRVRATNVTCLFQSTTRVHFEAICGSLTIEAVGLKNGSVMCNIPKEFEECIQRPHLGAAP